jgi:hypothetical protein
MVENVYGTLAIKSEEDRILRVAMDRWENIKI